MKTILAFLLVLYASLPIAALDLVTFQDGTTVIGEVSSYASLGEIQILLHDGSKLFFPSKGVRSIERQGVIGTHPATKASERIQYHEGDRRLFHYVPPRYTYRGMSYNIDTEWGMGSDVAEFFAYLREEHPDLDSTTLSLIQELEKGMHRQNISMGVAGIAIGTGTIMTFLPLNLDDLEATPPWAIGVSLGGFSLSVIGLGTMLYNAFIHYREYPPLIADSFNAFIVQKAH